MKNLITVTIFLFIIFYSVSVTFAIVFGGSNLGIFGYPKHTCTKPYSKPYKPYQFNSQWEIDSYNSDVESYNMDVSQYLTCIREYADNGKNDMDRIREAINDAINEAQTL